MCTNRERGTWRSNLDLEWVFIQGIIQWFARRHNFLVTYNQADQRKSTVFV
jgi:hypothetical protein